MPNTNNSVNYNLAAMTSTGITKYDGTTLITSTTAKIDSSNRYTNTSQPCFLVTAANSAANVTGDGTVYQVPYATVVFDQGSNFTTGASAHFTAPVTGKYLLTTTCYITPGVVGTNSFILSIVATSRTCSSILDYPAVATGTVAQALVCTSVFDMTANDTAYVTVIATGGTKTTAVASVPGFSGYLIC